MSLQYLTSEEIKNQKNTIKGLLGKPSWIVKKEWKTRFFSNYCKNTYGKSVCVGEIGIGSGLFLKAILDADITNITSVDIDDYLKFESLRATHHITDLNINAFPLNSSSIDVLFALQILEHLENPFFFARECSRVLKPGGSLFISIPNGNTIWDKWRFLTSGNLVNYHIKNNHITFLTRDVFTKTFLNYFKQKDTFYDHGWIPFLRPKKFNKYLPSHRLWSLNRCEILIKK